MDENKQTTMTQQIIAEVGDKITINGNEYEVVKIEDKLIWYKIPYGIGQTIRGNIDKITKRQ